VKQVAMKKLSLLLLVWGGVLFGMGHTIGEPFTPTTLADQHDRTQTLTPSTHIIIVAFDKAGYYDVTELFKTKGANYLSQNGIVFLNDISQIPSSILGYFVKPNMQKKPFPILLVTKEDDSKKLNYKEGMITLYTLKRGEIEKIEYANQETLKKMLP